MVSKSNKHAFIVFISFIEKKSMNGVIKTLKEKGFGFIAIEGESKDLFFHMNSLVGVSFDELREGDAVTFEKEEGQKGPSAVNVQKA